MSLLHTIHRAEQLGRSYLAEAIDDEITPAQLLTLAAIDENPGASQTALVNATGVDRSTLADIVRRLGKRGLATRKRTKEDARAYAVHLTAEGKQILVKARKAIPRIEDALIEKMPALKHLARNGG